MNFSEYVRHAIMFSWMLMIVVRPTAVRAISMDIIWQTIVQHCLDPDLELTATCSAKLRVSPYFDIWNYLFSATF